MIFRLIPLALAFHVLTTRALNIEFKQHKRESTLQRRAQTTAFEVTRYGASSAAVSPTVDPNGDNDLEMSSVRDLIYIANITVGNIEYPLQLDTGSSDVWIKGTTSPLPNVEQTPMTYNLTYGIGWAFGHISFAPTEFAGISVPRQAFLDTSAAQNPALGFGAQGIIGLGFTSLSTIDALLNRTSASTGRSLLYNLFEADPSQPNFIAFALQRTTAPGAVGQGSFSVGEYVPQYAGVADTPAIPTFPPNSPTRWTVLMDSFIVQGKTVSVSSTITGAPFNKAVALLDSGTSYSYAPVEVCDAIYKNIPGARFDEASSQWIVPCDTRIDMALQFNGRVFPIHPLDVIPQGIVDPSTCVGSFIPQTIAIGAGQFDWLIGDNFLRSVYSIYDFGDFDASHRMGNPYIKLLSIIDPNQAAREFHNIRGGTDDSNEPITYNASNSSTASGQTTLNLSDDVVRDLTRIAAYFPVVLGILALNVLAFMVLALVGSILLCKRKTNSIGALRWRPTRGRGEHAHTLENMPMRTTGNGDSGAAGSAPAAHTYEPVSMAMTDDTMIPPNSARKSRKWDSDSLSQLLPGEIRHRTISFSAGPSPLSDQYFPAPLSPRSELQQLASGEVPLNLGSKEVAPSGSPKAVDTTLTEQQTLPNTQDSASLAPSTSSDNLPHNASHGILVEPVQSPFDSTSNAPTLNRENQQAALHALILGASLDPPGSRVTSQVYQPIGVAITEETFSSGIPRDPETQSLAASSISEARRSVISARRPVDAPRGASPKISPRASPKPSPMSSRSASPLAQVRSDDARVTSHSDTTGLSVGGLPQTTRVRPPIPTAMTKDMFGAQRLPPRVVWTTAPPSSAPSDLRRTSMFPSLTVGDPRRAAESSDQFILSPPSPGFRRVDEERPRSIA